MLRAGENMDLAVADTVIVCSIYTIMKQCPFFFCILNQLLQWTFGACVRARVRGNDNISK